MYWHQTQNKYSTNKLHWLTRMYLELFMLRSVFISNRPSSATSYWHCWPSLVMQLDDCEHLLHRIKPFSFMLFFFLCFTFLQILLFRLPFLLLYWYSLYITLIRSRKLHVGVIVSFVSILVLNNSRFCRHHHFIFYKHHSISVTMNVLTQFVDVTTMPTPPLFTSGNFLYVTHPKTLWHCFLYTGLSFCNTAISVSRLCC